jgi:hypothetical protein
MDKSNLLFQIFTSFIYIFGILTYGLIITNIFLIYGHRDDMETYKQDWIKKHTDPTFYILSFVIGSVPVLISKIISMKKNKVSPVSL